MNIAGDILHFALIGVKSTGKGGPCHLRPDQAHIPDGTGHRTHRTDRRGERDSRSTRALMGPMSPMPHRLGGADISPVAEAEI